MQENTPPQRRYLDLYIDLIRCTDTVERERIRDRMRNVFDLMMIDPAVAVKQDLRCRFGDYWHRDRRQTVPIRYRSQTRNVQRET